MYLNTHTHTHTYIYISLTNHETLEKSYKSIVLWMKLETFKFTTRPSS